MQVFKEYLGGEGRLMGMQPDPNSRYKYHIWFDYTQRLMNYLRDGDLIGVPNFSSDENKIVWSVLEVTSSLPFHYALGSPQELRGYPGFLTEAAKNLAADWTTQVEESSEDTTKIICEAVPTELEFEEMQADKPVLREESSVPMIGKEVRILSSEMVEYIVNKGISPEHENTISVGALQKDAERRILLRVEDLTKTHFGIFGFTGTGKSNLASTVVDALLLQKDFLIKIVLFDLMGEYPGLLIDQFNKEGIDAKVICIGERTLPGPVLRYLASKRQAQPTPERVPLSPPTSSSSNLTLVDAAANSYLETLLLPKGLKQQQEIFRDPIKAMLENDCIRVWSFTAHITVDELVEEANPWRSRRRGGRPAQDISSIVSRVFGTYYQTNTIMTPQLAQTLRQRLSGELTQNTDYESDFAHLLRLLRQIESQQSEQQIDYISTEEIRNALMDTEKPSLFVINAHDPNELRDFAFRIGENLYETRRERGVISPLVLFVFDEADEFIPQEATGSYERSNQIAETLARRGRKFGMGVGIATQRVAYVNTKILANLHTYFISKLPREGDRNTVATGFGMSADMMRQTFKFKKGDWMLISHDATGLQGVPIPIHADNAEDRILKSFHSNN